MDSVNAQNYCSGLPHTSKPPEQLLEFQSGAGGPTTVGSGGQRHPPDVFLPTSPLESVQAILHGGIVWWKSCEIILLRLVATMMGSSSLTLKASKGP